MKMPPVGAELFHAYGQTHIKEPIDVLSNFVNESKNDTVPENGCFPVPCLVDRAAPHQR
jgi:hypothetical protein